MLVFALDTATLLGTYGWLRVDEGQDVSEARSFAQHLAPVKPGHAETLIGRMSDLLAFGGYQLDNIDLVVYGRGPGTFTGVRIGLSTVKGVALASRIPVIGISSLEAIAFSTGVTGLVAALIDARRRELFYCLYRVGVQGGCPVAEPLTDEKVGTADRVIAEISREAGGTPLHLTGNGVTPYRKALVEGLGKAARILPENRFAPDALWMARIGLQRFLDRGGDHLDTVEPVYLRKPDARLPQGK